MGKGRTARNLSRKWTPPIPAWFPGAFYLKGWLTTRYWRRLSRRLRWRLGLLPDIQVSEWGLLNIGGVNVYPSESYETVLLRDPCVYCGGVADTIDHIVPKSKGGRKFSWTNLTPACQACNYQKRSYHLLIYLIKRQTDPAKWRYDFLYHLEQQRAGKKARRLRPEPPPPPALTYRPFACLTNSVADTPAPRSGAPGRG